MIEEEVLKQESLPPIDIGTKNSLSPSEETLRRLGVHLQERFKKLKSLREGGDWEKEKAYAFNAYHMKEKNRALPYPGAANLSCPLPRIGVDSFHANVMASLFAEGNQMSIKPALIQKEMSNTAKKAAQYMQYVMNHECDSYYVIDDSDRKAHMYGVSYLEPYYEKEEIWETVEIKEVKRVPKIDPLGNVTFEEKKTVRTEKKKKTVFDGTRIRSLPIDSIYRSPFLKFEDALRHDCIIKIFPMIASEMKDRTKSSDERPPYFDRKKVAEICRSLTQKTVQVPSDLDQARSDFDGFWMDQLNDNNEVEMAEGYLWYDIDGDGIKEQIRVTFHPATGLIVRTVLNKCRIVDFDPRPVDERGYGEGIPRIIEPLCNEWENFHNSRSNAGQWENTTFGFYRAGGRFNPQKITIQPGHFYPVDDPREVQFAQVPRVGASYFQEEQIIQSYFEKVLAIDENFQGVPSRKNKTATETMSASSRASIRFGNPFNRIVSKMNKLLDHIWDLNRECAPEEKEFYVVGKDGSPIFMKMSKGDYSDRFKFQLEIQSVFDKQLIRDTMLLAYRLFIVNPYFQQHPEKLYEISQKTLDGLSIDIDIPKPPQAKTTSPYEKIEIIKNGGDIEPELGEDFDHQLKVLMDQLNSDDIKDWDPEAIKKLVMLIDKTKITKMTLESSQLNQSGQFSGPMQKQPPVTANRNPTQMFNNMKVGENQKSMMANNQNGFQGGQNVNQAMQETMGPV